MKRTLLTATAALALMATPAIAQVTNDDLTPQTDSELQNELPTDDEQSDALKPSDTWDNETELETDGDVEVGVGGEYYESEEDAQRDADLYDGEESDMDDNAMEPETDLETDYRGETEPESEMSEDGMGGPEATDRDDASERYGNLDANGEADADIDGLSEYEEDQVEKAGEDAVEDLDTVTQDDLTY